MINNIHKRFLFIVVLITLPFIMFVIYLNISEKKQLTDLKIKEIKNTTNLISTEYSNIVDNAKHLLIALAQNPTISNKNNPYCDDYLKKLLTQYQRYYNFGVANNRGDITCSALTVDQISSNISELSIFKKVINNHSFSFGEYRVSQLNKPIISFGYPLGTGIIFSSLDLSWLGQFSNSSVKDDQLIVTITDNNGTIIARNPDTENWVGKHFPVDEIIKKVESSQEKVSLSNGIDGVFRYYSYSRLGANNEGFYAIVGYPKDKIFQSSNTSFFQRLLLTLFVFIVTIIFSLYIGNKLIIQQVDALTKIDQLKDDFISLASHQIRTPLTSIKWFVELLSSPKSGNLNPKQQSMLNNINISTIKITQLINMLLDISKIENNNLVINQVSTDLASIINTNIVEYKTEIARKKLRIKLTKKNNLPFIMVDQKLISQVISNLIGNAIKYSFPKTTINLALTIKKNMLVVSISDRGLHIPETEKKLLFKKFGRTSNSIMSNQEGSGLGIYFSKLVINAHRGQIWFTSSLRKTTFYFSLPLV
ncbi:hypothetical protein KBC75_00515 [Candidatus Shapirobacteria bacterium]|nr:hypothetical protein [Candidatus Shapirobacteria bacterium]